MSQENETDPGQLLPPAARIYLTAVILGAAAAFVWLLPHGIVVRPLSTFLILAALVLFFESLPLRFSRRGQRFEFSIGSTFALGMLMIYGILPAVILQALGILIADVRTRKPWPKIAFNVAQFVVTLTIVGALLEVLVGRRIVYPGLSFEPAQIPLVLLAIVAFFVLNSVFTGTIVQLTSRWRVRDVVERFLSKESLIESSSLLLVPLIVVGMQRDPWLGLFLIGPITGLFAATKLALQNAVLLEERMEALAEKEWTERRFRSLVQNSSDLISLIDGSGEVGYSSSCFGQVNSPYLIRSNVLDCVHPEDRDDLAAGLTQVPGSPTPVVLPAIRLAGMGGSWGWVEMVLVDMLEDDAVQGIVLTVRDTSERRELEDRLRHSQKIEAVGQLAGGVAHDLNNALGVMQGYTQLALDSGPEDDSYRDDLKEVLKSSTRAARLIRQLLVFSRRDDVEPELMDVNAAIRDLWDLLQTTLTGRVDLKLDVPPTLPPVEIDPGHFEQVLINIAANARDAIGGKGSFEITGSFVAADGETDEGGEVRLRLSDSGSGIDPETMKHVFEPFFTTKERGSTSGLGLATVHGIVTRAGGRIAVESEPGRGTTFTIDLPAAPGDAAATEAASPADPRSQNILLVEDDPALCAVVERVLRRAGYRVLAADSAAHALALLDEDDGHVDLLLTDVIMPDVTGPQLAAAVLAARPTTKLLFMSGYTDQLIHLDEIGSQRPRLLQKPFSPDSLLAEVRSVLDEREPA